MGRKVAFEPDKRTWQPSVLHGQVILVSTVGADGEPNVAPKSWVTMAALSGPIVAFGCNTGHATYQNITASGEFVVNVPGEPIAEQTWSLAESHGAERLRRSGLTLVPAQAVKAPIVEDCRAHLECRLDSIKQFDQEVVIFGKIVAASIDAECLEGTPNEQYFRLRPFFMLEKGTYGTIDGAKLVGTERPTSHPLFMVLVGDRPGGRDESVVKDHFAFLRDLRSRGCMLIAGPFPGGPGGMYLLSLPSIEQAEETARRDPLVLAGAPYSVKPWLRTF